MTNPVRWSIQLGGFNNYYTSKVYILLQKLDAKKGIALNFHMDDSWGNHRYNMILGCDILSELKEYLRFSIITIRVNGGAYEVCTDPTK